MRHRWPLILICSALSLALLVCGLMVPAHLRGLDAGVLRIADRNGPSLPDQAKMLADQRKLGAAQLLLQAAQAENISGTEATASAWTNLVREQPSALFWGDDARTENIFGSAAGSVNEHSSFNDFIVRQENRRTALARLGGSQNLAVLELLRSRSLGKTVIFSPANSAAGQAFDAAVSTCGLLLDGGHLSAGMNDSVLTFATQANSGNSSQPLEQVLLDFTSLGERFNWDQLAGFVSPIQDVESLHRLAGAAREAGEKLPVLFAAVVLSGRPADVAGYLAKFHETGLRDLGASLRLGAGAVGGLAQSRQRLYEPKRISAMTAHDPFGAVYRRAAEFYARQPGAALAAKWLMYFLAGFFLALVLHFARPAATRLEGRLQVSGIHVARELLFSLGFLLVVLLWSEPFLAQDSQGVGFTFRLLPPTTGGSVPAGIAGVQQMIMSPTILLTLLVFFVLQALIYISCLVKLAEIRRQNVPPRMKLKLLENEDHLFDAGLYLGFVGTIVSLIIASMGLVKFSLMAAYSSTSFGIIFVVIFKIFHLRPMRRKLLMESEWGTAETTIPAATPQPVMPS